MASSKKNLKLINDKVFGIVKWFAKGQGRIAIEEYGEIFVHFSEISKPAPKCYNPQKFLKKGQTVQCSLHKGPKGLQATNVVVVIDSAIDEDGDNVKKETNIKVNVNVVSPTPACPATVDESCDSTAEYAILESDLRGEVISFNKDRAFGFIKTHQYGSIFCHYSHIDFAGLHSTEKILVPTQFVKCDVARGKKGLMAVHVHVISESVPGVTKDRKRSPSSSRQPQVRQKSIEASKKPQKLPLAPVAVPTLTDEDTMAKSKIIQENVLGEVLNYNAQKKFGFIKISAGDAIYVHKRSLLDCESLIVGQVVKFDVTHGPKSKMAINVKIVGTVASQNDEQACSIKANAKDEVKSKKKKKQDQCPASSAHADAKLEKRNKDKTVVVEPHKEPSAPPFFSTMNPMYPQPVTSYPHTQSVPAYPYPSSYINCAPPLMNCEPPPPYHPPPPSYPDSSDLCAKFAAAQISKPVDPKPSVEATLRVGIAKELVCGICEDLLDDPVMTPCEHLFCRGCLLEWLPFNPTCPIDRKSTSKDQVKDAPKAIKNMLARV